MGFQWISRGFNLSPIWSKQLWCWSLVGTPKATRALPHWMMQWRPPHPPHPGYGFPGAFYKHLRWNPMVQRLPTVRHWEVWALEDWKTGRLVKCGYFSGLYRYQKGCYWSSHSAMIRLSEAGVVWKFETPFHFKGQNLILLLKMVTNWGIPRCVPPHFCRSLPRRVGFQRALGSKKTPLLRIEMWNPWPDSCQAGLGLRGFWGLHRRKRWDCNEGGQSLWVVAMAWVTCCGWGEILLGTI